MRTGTASAIGTRRHNENDVTMTIAGLWRYGNWRHVAMGCTALVIYKAQYTHEFCAYNQQQLYQVRAQRMLGWPTVATKQTSI